MQGPYRNETREGKIPAQDDKEKGRGHEDKEQENRVAWE